MECVEAALKTSFRKEMGFKTSVEAILDDFWPGNSQNGVSGEDFLVEEFLDLSNDDGFLEKEEAEAEEDKALISPPKKKDSEDLSSNESTEYGSLPASELSVPEDVVENLEWLSHFVEDSFSEHSAAFPAGAIPLQPKTLSESQVKPENPDKSFKTPVPAKARSKRTRTGGRLWSLVGSPSVTESSSSPTSSSSSCSPSSPCLIYAISVPGSGSISEPTESVLLEKVKPPPVKKQKKKPATDSAGGNVAQPPRRCSHCGVTKTPQWRAGPLGAKTLCNACGVRFKSGRLLPEYRPACSPTFSSELHSNHHRKVLEMRKKREGDEPEAEVEPTLPPPALPSFC